MPQAKDAENTVVENLPETGRKADQSWRGMEIAPALVHLSYMHDHSMSPKVLPRKILAELLGVSRQTVWRAQVDAEESFALAEEINRRLAPYYEQRRKQEEERRVRRIKARERANARNRERRRAKRAAAVKGRKTTNVSSR